MGLITLAEAKTHLGVSGTADDQVVTDMIAAAGEAMERHCGRNLESTAVTEVLDGTGKRFGWLGEPAESVTSVHVSADQSWTDANLVDASDYRVDGSTLDHLNEIWPVGRSNVQVVYQAGFATVPDDLQHAAKAQVAKMYADWQTVKEGANTLEGETIEGWTRKWRKHGGLDEEVAAICDRYLPDRL